MVSVKREGGGIVNGRAGSSDLLQFFEIEEGKKFGLRLHAFPVVLLLLCVPSCFASLHITARDVIPRQHSTAQMRGQSTR